MFIQKNKLTQPTHQDLLFSVKTAKLFLLTIFIVLVISSLLLIPYNDSYYYWDWGRHLALSYFDGPPMIAYFMHLFTWIFGETTYAINFLGVASIYLTIFFIYKTGEMLFGKRIALNACLLWLLSALVLHYLFIWVTYDNPLNLFWAATVYFVVRFIQDKKTIDLYWIGCSIGLLLLSKYTGIVLLLALLFFSVITPSYWALLRNKHFYFAILLALLIASPVIIWNYQHAWISLSYQLTVHGDRAQKTVLDYLWIALKNYNILLFLPLYALVKSFTTLKKNAAILFLHIVAWTFLGFFLLQSLKHSISTHWLTPFCITSSILCSYYFVEYQLRKLFLLTMTLYILASLYCVVGYSALQKYIDGNVAAYALAKDAGERYVNSQTITITADWETASQLLFWLPGKPFIYTLPCGAENQYTYWSQPIVQKIKNKQIKQAIYLDFVDRSSCINKYFTRCDPLPVLSYENQHFRFNKGQKMSLFIYRCTV